MTTTKTSKTRKAGSDDGVGFFETENIMATIIDGRAVSKATREQLKNEVEAFKQETGVVPALAVILVGDDPASAVYVRNKHKGCLECGIRSIECRLSADTSEEELLSIIDSYNKDPEVHGILVQLPLPSHIDEKKVQLAILPEKDVDAFHPMNVGALMSGDATFLPCTPSGVIRLLEYYDIETEGKSCVIIGRSNIVGKPMMHLMLEKNATVTVCHSRTKNLKDITRTADILICAIGKAEYITAEHIKRGAVVIDVGINRTSDGRLVGDVKFAQCSEIASYITPVPGGVGPMTIAMLLENTLRGAKKQIKKGK